MSAHWFDAMRREIAHLFYKPFATTAWQPTPPLALPSPKQQETGPFELPEMTIQTTGGMRLPINNGKPWHGPAGTLAAISRGTSPHRRRERITGPIDRLHTHLTPIPEPERDEFGFSDLETWKTPETIARQTSDALARIEPSQHWLYDAPPVLAPLPTDALAVADKIAQPGKWEASTQTTDAFAELLRHNSETLEVPSVTKEIARRHRKESE